MLREAKFNPLVFEVIFTSRVSHVSMQYILDTFFFFLQKTFVELLVYARHCHILGM